MSRSCDLGHVVMEIRPSSFREDLKALIDFDEDINGNNGMAYTRKEAIEEGFKSTIDYIVSKALEFGATEEAIRFTIDESLGNEDYYYDYKYTILKNNNSFTVAISYMYGN